MYGGADVANDNAGLGRRCAELFSCQRGGYTRRRCFIIWLIGRRRVPGEEQNGATRGALRSQLSKERHRDT